MNVWVTPGRTEWGHQITKHVPEDQVPEYTARDWKVYDPTWENRPMPTDRYPQLVALLKDMGIPDRYGWIGGLRMRLAKMLVDLVRTQGRQKVQLRMTAALGLAEMIVLEETPPLPPEPRG